jgi:MerR family mercuric resistance operon transcriptional regulator
MPSTDTLTIGRLARAAGVGVETIRYYQRRALLPVPAADGAVRRYPGELIDRIRFIKRAQELGFTLQEIGQLLDLEDGADRASIRHIAVARLVQIERKLADLERMHTVLSHLIDACRHTAPDIPCPIIATLGAGEHPPRTRMRHGDTHGPDLTSVTPDRDPDTG